MCPHVVFCSPSCGRTSALASSVVIAYSRNKSCHSNCAHAWLCRAFFSRGRACALVPSVVIICTLALLCCRAIFLIPGLLACALQGSIYTRYVEIEGKVVNEGCIEEYACTNYGDEGFGMYVWPRVRVQCLLLFKAVQ